MNDICGNTLLNIMRCIRIDTLCCTGIEAKQYILSCHITPHHFTTHFTTPHHTTSHDTTLHHTTPHYTTLHHTTPHYTTLHPISNLLLNPFNATSSSLDARNRPLSVSMSMMARRSISNRKSISTLNDLSHTPGKD